MVRVENVRADAGKQSFVTTRLMKHDRFQVTFVPVTVVGRIELALKNVRVCV